MPLSPTVDQDRAGEVAQLEKCLPSNHEGLTLVKSWERHLCVIAMPWSRDRQIPRAGHGGSVSLAKMPNSRVNDRPCLKNCERTWLRKMSSVNLRPTHTPTSPYMHPHRYTCQRQKRRDRQDISKKMQKWTFSLIGATESTLQSLNGHTLGPWL